MKQLAYFLLSLPLVFAGCVNKTRPVLNCETYAEGINPDTTDRSLEWGEVENFTVSFGSVNHRYAKGEVPDIKPEKSWQGSGWKGETISAQIVMWSPKPIEQIECEFTQFKSANGDIMDASIANARFVRYVLTDVFQNGCGYRKPEDFPSSLSADGLDNIACFSISENTARPVWISLNIPRDAKPGIYAGKVNIYARNKKTNTLDISIEVLPQTLPEVKDWKFHLDLWQHPTAVARTGNVELWSEEHWKLIESTMAILASAGQKVITATLNKDPWNNQCYDGYADMIKWTKKQNGFWEYDYTVFDRWVSLMMNLGIKGYINCYSMLPWNSELHYYDEKENKMINISAPPKSKEFAELWTPFLKNFRLHLESKGWLKITNIAIDERAPEDVDITLSLLEKVAPELGVSFADNHKSYKQYPTLRDVCASYGNLFDAADLEFRKNKGLISTYYVCCSDKFPNVFTFSEPAEATYIAWHAVAAGYDGFLRWAYNSWTENPLIDSRFRTWPAGDTYIVYPGARSSIRFERLKEGIQDAEKIWILKAKFESEGNQEKLEILNNTLAAFAAPGIPEIPTGVMINRAKKILEALSR